MKYQAKFKRTLTLNMGRDSTVGVALAMGWTVQESNPGGGEIF
jgi:hypothetical protein